MSYKEVSERIGRLDNAKLYGFVWKDQDLHISLDGYNFSALICHWAYDLKVDLDWDRANGHNKGGPLHSYAGQLVPASKVKLEMELDFGMCGVLSVRCGDITVVA